MTFSAQHCQRLVEKHQSAVSRVAHEAAGDSTENQVLVLDTVDGSCRRGTRFLPFRASTFLPGETGRKGTVWRLTNAGRSSWQLHLRASASSKNSVVCISAEQKSRTQKSSSSWPHSRSRYLDTSATPVILWQTTAMQKAVKAHSNRSLALLPRHGERSKHETNRATNHLLEVEVSKSSSQFCVGVLQKNRQGVLADRVQQKPKASILDNVRLLEGTIVGETFAQRILRRALGIGQKAASSNGDEVSNPETYLAVETPQPSRAAFTGRAAFSFQP